MLDALDMAIDLRGLSTDVLVHADQGSQYTAETYWAKLKANDIQWRMSRKGQRQDNAVVESIFQTLKEELRDERNYVSRTNAKQSIIKYIEIYYNRQSLDSTLGYKMRYEYKRMHAAV